MDELSVEGLDALLDLILVPGKPRNPSRRKLAGPPERRAEKLNNLLHKHSVFRWLDLLNKRTANRLNKRLIPSL